MFYLKDKVAKYPGKSVMEDVVGRYGEPNEMSFTPYKGMAEIVEKQFMRQGEFALSDFMLYCTSAANEFNPDKIKPTNELDDMSREQALAYQKNEDCVYSSNYYWKLEDINENWVARYVNQKAIGYKLESGGRKQYNELNEVAGVVRDKETDALVTLAELEEVEMALNIDDVREAKDKLPFLLKQLHKGSVYRGVSLLSFIFAYERAYDRYKRSGSVGVFDIAPRDFYDAAGTYEMQHNGMLGRRFEGKDNKCDKFRDVVKWISGQYPNDRYYKFFKELQNVASVLDITLANEDARDYQNNVIDKAMCLYLENNMEYLDGEGYLDKRVLSALNPNELFQVGYGMDRFEEAEIIRELTIEQKRMVRLLRIQDCVRRDEVDYDVACIKIQAILNIIAAKQRCKPLNVAECCIADGLLKDRDGFYIQVKASDVIVDAMYKDCYISANGWLIVDEQSDVMAYYDLMVSSIVTDAGVQKYDSRINYKEI